VINRLVGLKQLQEEYETIEEQYKAQRIALEKQFYELRKPIFKKRADVLNGKVDVEVESSSADAPAPASTSSGIKGIPGFWLQCIANHPTASSLLGEKDGPALEALTDISFEYSDDFTGFKLFFTFAPNDYFSNDVLTKSYTVSPDLLDETAPALTSVDGTEIQWKDKSKNLCETEIKKKQKSKKGGQTRYVTQMVAQQSFFHFFSDPHMDDEDEDDDEEGGGAGGEGTQKHEFQLSVDADYEIGHMFRTEIIPSAILWFTGEADGGLDLMDDEDEDDDEEGEDEDEDDDEDPAEESEDVDATKKGKSRKGKGPGAAGAAPGAAGEQPECKQS
jgi:nucleosome assembly protein 1-like 1